MGRFSVQCFAFIDFVVCVLWMEVYEQLNSAQHMETQSGDCNICTLVFVGTGLQNYYSSMLLLTVVSYVLCGRRMLKSYTNNVKLLQSQIAILSNNQTAEIVKKSPAKIKLNILTKFQKAIVVYI